MGAVLAPIIFPSLVAGSTAATVAAAGINLALYAGTAAASIYLQSQMQPRQEQEIGTKLSVVLGGAVNQSVHVGRKETAGSLQYEHAWGINGRTPNAFLSRVMCLGDREVDGFEDYVWGDGLKCNYDPNETQTIDGFNVGHPIPKFDSGGGHRVWVKFHTGAQDNADNYLVDKFGDDDKRPWTEDHIGRGRPYMIVTQKYDKKNTTGEVQILAVIKNSALYDLRDDSTNGGSGSQRYGNEGTYGVDPGNPVIVIYNIMRGIYQSGDWMFGGHSWSARRFDNSSWIAAANKCDEDVPISGGGTQKRFRIGAEIDVSEEPWTVIERCLKACNGRIVESGGIFKIYVGGVGASVWSFTDDHILVSEDLTARLFPGRDEIFNTVTGTYVEPDNAGEAKAYKSRTKLQYIEADGEVRKTTLDFEYVRDNRQAQRLAMLALNDNRRFRTFVVAFWTPARKLEPCDVVSWTSERFGFIDKKFICGDVTLRPDGVVIVNLREVDNADSDWETSDEDEFETGVFEDFDEPTQTLTATVTAVEINDDNGKKRRCGIRIQAAIDDDFVDCRALRYRVRKKNGDQKQIYRGRSEGFFEVGDPDYGDVTFTDNSFLEGRQVQVWYKIEPESDRETAWNGPVDLTLSEILPDTPTNLALTQISKLGKDGKRDFFVKATWDAVAHDNNGYGVKIVVDGEQDFEKADDNAFRFPVPAPSTVDVQVRTRHVDSGKPGAYCDVQTINVVKKAGLPTTPTQLTIVGKNHRLIVFTEDHPDDDFRRWITYHNTVNNFSGATKTKHARANRFSIDGLDPGVDYWVWLTAEDNSGNESNKFPSSNTGGRNGFTEKVTDDDLDDTAPNTPGVPTLTTSSADVDKDGTQETFLTAAWTQGGSVAVKAYNLEVWRSSTIGGSYALWKEFEVDGEKLSKKFQANSNFFYKARAKAKGGAKFGNSSFSALTTTGVQPIARGFNLTTAGIAVTWESYRKKHVVRIANLPVDDPEFAYVEIYQRTGASTWTRVDRGKKDMFVFLNPPSNVQKYRAVLYTQTLASNAVNYESSGTAPTVGNDGVDDIVASDLSAGCVTTVKLANSAVTADKLAHSIVFSEDNHMGASVADNILITLANFAHGDCDQVCVIASFINNAGAPRTDIDVSLEVSGGITFSSMTVSLEDDGECVIFGNIGRANLDGDGTTTLQMRVSGSFEKRDRKIMAWTEW